MKLDRNTFKRVLQESMSDVFNDYIDPSENIDGIEAEQEEEGDTLDDPINHSFTNKKLGEIVNSVSDSIVAEMKAKRLKKFIDESVKKAIKENKKKRYLKF